MFNAVHHYGIVNGALIDSTDSKTDSNDSNTEDKKGKNTARDQWLRIMDKQVSAMLIICNDRL